MPAHEKGKSKKKFLVPTGVLIGIVVVALAVIIVLAAFELGLFTPVKEDAEPQEFVILDRCSMFVGQIIHPIGDQSSCEMICKAECEVREMEYSHATFTAKNETCNSCSCVCD